MPEAPLLQRDFGIARSALVLMVAAVMLAALFWTLRSFPLAPTLQEVARNGALATLRSHQADLSAAMAQLGWRGPALFALIYITLAGLTLPINVPLSVAAGALFGLWPGTVLALFCTAIGASLSCLMSRTLLRGWVTRKLYGRMAEVEAGLAKDGALYLLSLRLMPLVPYTMVNLLFGLTSISLPRFFAITALGTLPATFAFANAGTQLQQLGDDGMQLGLRLGISLALLGCVPLCVKPIAAQIRRWR